MGETYTQEQVIEATLDWYRERGADEGTAQLAAATFAKKYALRDKEGRFHERTPTDMHQRMAREFARIEAKYPNPLSASEIFAYLEDFTIVPQGSPMFGVGNPYQAVSVSNCSVVPGPEDSLSGIMNTGRDLANLYKRRFGAGTDLSKLRPQGARVNNAAITSTGAWSFADLYSYITRMVGMTGRRGALMLTLSILHPDVESFIDMKRDLTKVTGANVSVRVMDEFMHAVLADEEIALRWPVDAYLSDDVERLGLFGVKQAAQVKKVRARDLFRKIAQAACDNGEPGVLFWDTIRRTLPLDCYPGFETVSTNPCLTGDTPVAVADGRGFVPIRTLAEEGVDVPVYAVGPRGNLVIRTMRHPRVTGRNVPVYEVEIEGGHTFRATGNHKLLTSEGEYREVQDLQTGDSLHIGYRTLGTIKDFFPGANANSQEYVWVRNQNRKSYEPEHRKIYEYHYGEIPAGHVIHHVDYNGQNNTPKNLDCLSKEAHDELHRADKLGEKNPYHRMDDAWRERFHASTRPAGEGNGNHSGWSNEEVRTAGQELARSLGRRFSRREWRAHAESLGAPVAFSPYRVASLGTMPEFSRACAEAAGVAEYADLDPRLVRTYHSMLDQGYEARIQGNQVEVLRHDELTGEPFWIAHDRREISFASQKNALDYLNRDPEFQARRTQRTREAYPARKQETERKQQEIFTRLSFTLGRAPRMKEWEAACRGEGISSRLGSRLSTWKNYGEFARDAANFNHRVLRVREVGQETVYNGTVDEVHNFYFGGWEERKEGKPRWVMLNNRQCGELPLSEYDSCRLISQYLPGYVQGRLYSGEASLDLDYLQKATWIAMRLSDDLVDIEIEKLQEIRALADTEDERELFDRFIQSAEQGRRTGLGTHGLGDMLLRLGIRYDSEEALETVDRVYREIKYTAYEASIALAQERGAFPLFDWETEKSCAFWADFHGDERGHRILEQMQKYGRRNGAILTNAPTGSVSILTFNCSSGIEPIYQNSYERKTKVAHNDTQAGDYTDANGDRWVTYRVYHPEVQHYRQQVDGEGPLPDFFVTAEEIDWRYRVKMQAALTRHIDHAVSSTINLPRGTTADVVEEIYLQAWKSGCKGITVYVDGSRDAQVLSSGSTENTLESSLEQEEVSFLKEALEGALEDTRFFEARVQALETQLAAGTTRRGRKTEGEMTKAQFTDSEGRSRKVYVYVGTNEAGEPVEVFLTDNAEKEGYHEALAKLISLALKFRIPPRLVAEKLKGIRGVSTSFDGGVYQSVPDMAGKLLFQAIPDVPALPEVQHSPAARVIQAEGTAYPARSTPSGETCPSCGAGHPEYRRVDGCPTCYTCGYSNCS